MSAEPLCLVFVPALVCVLHAAESNKGSPLTEAEVTDIRDKAICIALSVRAALEMEEKRGYDDIVAQDCWNQWQKVRETLA